MARFQQAVRTSNVTSTNAALEIIAGSKGCRVWSVKINVASAVATVLGIGRPATAGLVPATLSKFLSIDNIRSFSLSQIALTWGTSPTAPAAFFERVSTTGAIGFLRDLFFPQGLYVSPNATLTLHNITGGATIDATVDISEDTH